MKLPLAAVIEPKAPQRKALIQGLKKAGLKISDAEDAYTLGGKEGLIVFGPSVKDGKKAAKTARKLSPNAVVLAAQKSAPFADGVLPLPISAKDLIARLPELMELKALKAKNAAVKREPSEPRSPSARPGEGILDPLTQFYTFAHFKEVLFIEVKRARRYGFPLSIALLAFDPLNVEMTPQLRSQLMAGLALAIRRSLRDTDYPVQYSADRVMLLMPHTDLPGSLVVSRRIVERVAKASLTVGRQVISPTISIGVAATPMGKEIGFGELARQANESLSAALAGGGNRVEFYDSAAAAAANAEQPPRAQTDPA